jgi:Flp pilus assembly protein TadD
MRLKGLWIALCCLLLHPAFLTAADPGWIEVRSEHFSVITDAGEKNGRHVVDLFEQMRAAFGLIFVRTKINQPIPLQIIAFRNTKEFRQYCPIFKGKVVEMAGFFQQTEDKNFIIVDMSQEDNWQIVFHEYAHLLLNGNFPETAPWFDEGFAEYLSTMKVNNGVIEIGQFLPGSDLLDQGGKFHLLDLFRVQHHSETYYQSGERRDMFYVESWLVTHYLFDTDRISQAARYFVLTNQQKVPIPDAVQAAFGMSPAEMEKAIWNNWHNGKLLAKRYNGSQRIPLSFDATARPLDPLEVRAELADLHLHSPDYAAKATQEFEDILRQNPNLVAAQRGLGYAYLRNQNVSQAQEHFQMAAKLGSSDSRVYYYSAVLLQQAKSDAMNSPEFTQYLQHAIQLDPQYADAYHLLGLALMQAGKYPEAEQNIRHAVDLSPRNDLFRLNLAAVILDEQKTADGKAMLATLTNSSDPRVAQQASQMMLRLSDYESMATRNPPGRSDVDMTNAQTVASPSDTADHGDAEPVLHRQDTDKRSVAFLSGKIVSVDCPAGSAAVLTVLSSGKTYRLRTADREKLVLINAGKFSCDWKDVKADVNYRVEENLQGEVVSLELP